MAGLATFYRMNSIFHNEDIHVHGTLEAQLLSFPRSKFWDVMDCFANCIEMFNLGNRNFSFQFADEQLGKIINIEDEYEMLRIEDKAERRLNRISVC